MSRLTRRGRFVSSQTEFIQFALDKTPLVDPFMDEHLAIIEALEKKSVAKAMKYLTAHLKSSSLKAQERLKMFRNRRGMPELSYIAEP